MELYKSGRARSVAAKAKRAEAPKPTKATKADRARRKRSTPARWSVAEARGRLAEVLAAASEAPQQIYRRDEPVGVLIAPATYEELLRLRESARTESLGEAFARIRRAFAEEGGGHLEAPSRVDADRPNAFLQMLEEEYADDEKTE